MSLSPNTLTARLPPYSLGPHSASATLCRLHPGTSMAPIQVRAPTFPPHVVITRGMQNPGVLLKGTVRVGVRVQDCYPLHTLTPQMGTSYTPLRGKGRGK